LGIVADSSAFFALKPELRHCCHRANSRALARIANTHRRRLQDERTHCEALREIVIATVGALPNILPAARNNGSLTDSGRIPPLSG